MCCPLKNIRSAKVGKKVWFDLRLVSSLILVTKVSEKKKKKDNGKLRNKTLAGKYAHFGNYAHFWDILIFHTWGKYVILNLDFRCKASDSYNFGTGGNVYMSLLFPVIPKKYQQPFI